MPWQELAPMDQRLLFIRDHARGAWPMAALCAQYGVSEKTGYKWLARYAEGGAPALADRSHAPHRVPHALPSAAADALLALRAAHPRWGPRKLVAYLRDRAPNESWPAPSTVGALLHREGLARPRRRRAPLGHPGKPTTVVARANQLWTADFKGQFKTRDGMYCYPLTVCDAHSRFLLGCRALDSVREAGAVPVFRALFREYGLPEAIRTDNGVPFATTALGRLSRLAVWWIRLGVRPELTQPSHPEQNGRHERMHRTLKAETTRPPEATGRAQQRRFDAFRRDFNAVRPHEALGQRPPARVYTPSPRPYPARLPALAYPGHWEVRRVSRNGGVRWHNHWVNVSHVLGEEYVGLEPVADGLWSLYLGPVLLGRFDERTLLVTGTYSTRLSPIMPV
jgi:putative transposase